MTQTTQTNNSLSQPAMRRRGNRLLSSASLRKAIASNECGLETLEPRVLFSAMTAPTALAAVAQLNSVSLTWTDKDSTATSYQVQRATDGKTFSTLATLTGGQTNSYHDNSVSNDVTYTYKVVAQSASNSSPASVTAVATVAPVAPSGLVATNPSGATVNLSWKSTDPNAAGFAILRSTDGNTFAVISTITGVSNTTFVDTAASPLTNYYYCVASTTGTGSSLVMSKSSVVQVKTGLAAPTSLAATTVNPTSVAFSFTAGGTAMQGFLLLRSSDGKTFTQVAKTTSTTASITDATAAADTSYSYEVESYNGSPVSPVSNVVKVGTPAIAPATLTVTGGVGTETLTWAASDPNATGYVVYRSTDGKTFAAVKSITSGATTTCSDTSLQPATTYYYQVKTVVGINLSAASVTASAKTGLAAPSGLAVNTLTSSVVNLYFKNGDTGAQGFLLLRSTDGKNFSQVAKTTTASLLISDTAASADTAYSYEVEEYNGTTVSAPSNLIQVTTLPAALTTLSVTATGPTAENLKWTSTDTKLTGFVVLRSTDGKTFSTLATLNSGSATSYADTTCSSFQNYFYEVEATAGNVVSAASNIVSAKTTLFAPTNLNITASTGTAVTLSWTGNDSNAAGYAIFRSLAGSTFTQVGKTTSANATTYTDSTVASNSSYVFEVQAVNGTVVSVFSNTATTVTPLVTPSGLTATIASGKVTLSWSSTSQNLTGLNVFRSTDGVTFTKYATVTSATATSYTDSAVTGGTTYWYQVQAVSGATVSQVSSATSVLVPVTAGGVTVATRFGNELIVTAAGTSDSVTLDQSGSTLTLSMDGQTVTEAVPAAGVFLYARSGNDSFTVNSDVKVTTTVETIDTGTNTVVANGANMNVWVNSTDTVSGTATGIHKVASFAAGVSKATGAALADPTDSGSVTKINMSLFGTGPVANDINQGSVGDCYFLSSLAAFANSRPGVLTGSAVDMGDGTYAVQFFAGSTPSFVRVNSDMPSGGWGGFKYAHPGVNNTAWAMVMEKAWCYFRTKANTYNSINAGWMGSVYNALGFGENDFYTSGQSESAFYATISAALKNGQAVTLGTYSSPPDLVGGHAYTLIRVYQDSAGTHYVVRNPWGMPGDAIEDANGYATLTFAQIVSNFVDGSIAVG